MQKFSKHLAARKYLCLHYIMCKYKELYIYIYNYDESDADKIQNMKTGALTHTQMVPIGNGIKNSSNETFAHH